MSSKLKYKNYKELKKAYDSGELSKEYPLQMDNDDSFVFIGEKQVFQGNGRYDIMEILEAWGIPCEEV